MICPSCGRENPDGANFCRFCGGKLVSPQAQPAAPAQAAQSGTYVNAAPQTQSQPREAPQAAQSATYVNAVPQTQPQPLEAPQAAQSATYVNAVPQTQPQPREAPQTAQSGTYVNAAPVQTEQAAKKAKKKLFGKKEKSDEPQQAVQTDASVKTKTMPRFDISIGTVLLLTFLAVELLPYLLRSLLMEAGKMTLSSPVFMLCGAVGWCISGGVLFLLSKKLSGSPKPGYVLAFLGLIAIYRQSEAILMPLTSKTFAVQTSVFYIAMAVIQFIADILLLIPLGKLFSDKGSIKQGGKLLPLLLVIAAMNLDMVLNLAWSFTLSGTDTSFVSTCAYRIIGAFLEALLFSLAAERLLKKQKSKGTPEKKKRSFVFGAVSAGAAVGLAVYLAIPNSVTVGAAKDMQNYITQGLLFLGTGDMVAAERAYEQAGEHFSAWKTLAEGGSYSVPGEFSDDEILLYFTKLSDNTESLRKFLATSYDEENADMYLPLMLERYKQKGELSEDETEHRKEVLSLCIANEIFTANYPTKETIVKKGGDILDITGSDPEKEYARYHTLASILAGFETCETSFSSGISDLIECASQNPDDLSIQYITATLGSSNVWDGAGHFDGTSEAVQRFRSLWFDEYGESATREEIDSVELSCGNMLMNIHKYDKAADLLKKAADASPDSFEIKQLLANCYIQLDDAENSYRLAKEMYETHPDDVTTLWLYSVGALKKGNKEEAVKIAGELADVVKNDESEPELDGDVLLFTCVTYLALNDSASYTDYKYRIFDGDSTDPKLLAEFKKNDFLYDYVNALYLEKQVRDPEKALPFAKKALSYQENSGRLWYLNGMINFDMKEYEDAKEAYVKANTLVPNDPSTMFALANTYDALEEYQEAYDLCVKIEEMYPNGAEHLVDYYGVSAHVGGLLSSLKGYVKE